MWAKAKVKTAPSNGIYACRAYLDGVKYLSMTNIGTNPTFTPDKQSSNVEAYLLDFDRDIYEQDLKVEFVKRLRDEVKFSSVDALLAQIELDVQQGRKLLTGV